MRPALVGDPLSYSDAQLVALGFPPRPDPKLAPDTYQRWLKLVSHSATIVVGSRQPVPMPGSHGINDFYWAGYRVTSHPIYTQLQAVWQVPYPYGETNNLGFTDSSSLWVGLGDGGSNGDLWQGGSEQDVTCYVSGGDIGCVRGYYSCVEVVSGNAQQACCTMVTWDMSFTSLHYAYVALWLGDIYGNPKTSLTQPLYAWWYFWDETARPGPAALRRKPQVILAPLPKVLR